MRSERKAVTAVRLLERRRRAANVLSEGSVKVGEVGITASDRNVIDPVILMDQSALRFPDPAADNIAVDRKGRVFPELSGQVILAQMEVISDGS